MKTWMKWAIAAVVVVILGVVGGPFVYINFIKEDAEEELASSCVAADAATGATTGGSAFTPSGGGSIDPAGVAGTWTVGPGSTVGYRVVEVLFGQDTTAVGRTESVTGSLTVEGEQITAAAFDVDMTSVTSQEARRDNQFRGRLMDVEQFPTATFTLTAPAPVPSAGTDNRSTVTGDLTMRGVTRPVTLEMTALDCGGYLDVLGSTDIAFEDFAIPDPSSAGISTQDHGVLEVKLRLVPA